MNIACVSEGDTEYFCVPKFVGRRGHTVVFNAHSGGCGSDWDQAIERQLLPLVRTAALRHPDKILVVLDRERRECSPELAERASCIITCGLAAENLIVPFAVVIADRTFESILMADYELVDRLPILSRSVSQDFGPSLDGMAPKAIIDRALKPGAAYHKVRHGGALASKMRLDEEAVIARSRSLRKLLKELPVVSD